METGTERLSNLNRDTQSRVAELELQSIMSTESCTQSYALLPFQSTDMSVLGLTGRANKGRQNI